MIKRTQPRLAGLILAGGHSRRMGALKQTLSWPAGDAAAPSTVVASAFDAIAHHVDAMFVAVGDDAPAVLAALGERRFRVVKVDSSAAMFESIRAGVRDIARAHAGEGAAFNAALIQPGDHPGVTSSTIERVLAAFRGNPECACMPEHDGKGGHPVVVPRSLFEDLTGLSGERGLRQVWIDHPAWRVRIRVDDPWCVFDLDGPDDYARGLEEIRHRVV